MSLNNPMFTAGKLLVLVVLLWPLLLIALLQIPTSSYKRGYAVRASVGIDLGTTYSLCSVTGLDGKPRTISVDGCKKLPSVVVVQPFGELKAASMEATMDSRAQRTFSSMKRVIGKLTREVAKMQENYFKAKLSITPLSDLQHLALFESGNPGLQVTAEEIAACIIRKLVAAAEGHLRDTDISKKNVTVDKAVITVPAYFNQAQRDATERAGKLAGLAKVKLLKEPEAAALAYGLNLQTPQLVLVFDLGGGTLDVSVLEVGGGLVEVVATTGDAHLGGDDVDALVADWLWAQYALLHAAGTSASSARRSEEAQRSMIRLAREVKEALSTQTNVTVVLPAFRAAGSPGSRWGGAVVTTASTSQSPPTAPSLSDLMVTLTRRALETMCRPLLARMLLPLREVAMAAGINLQGDSAALGVDAPIEETMQREDREVSRQQNDVDVRALQSKQLSGRATARQRRQVQGQSRKELNRLQQSQSQSQAGSGGGGLSLFPVGRSLDALLLVGGATRMPCVRNAVQVVTGLVALSQERVNPDEAVCLGAGTMAGMLDGVIPDMQVVSPWQSAMIRFLKEEKLKGNELLSKKADAK